MAQRFSVPSASIVMLLKTEDGKRKVLLQRRQNTGFADGLWDFSCSGHVEQGESMSQAAVREAKEELGINIPLDKIFFFALVHKREKERDLTYYNAYFVCEHFSGEPHICEIEKCSKLQWFDIDNLPDDLIPDRKKAVQSYLNGVHYFEYGWE